MKLVRCAKTGNIISGAAFFILGIVLAFFPEISLALLCRAAGVVMLASGIVRIIGYFSKDLYYLAFQFDFALGIFSVLFGAILLFRLSWFVSAFQIFIGAFVLINGLFALQTAMDSKRFGMKYWWVLLIIAILSSVTGFAVTINLVESAAAVTVLVGLTLMFVGAEKIFVSVYTVVTKKTKEEKNSTYVDLSNFTDYRERTE